MKSTSVRKCCKDKNSRSFVSGSSCKVTTSFLFHVQFQVLCSRCRAVWCTNLAFFDMRKNGAHRNLCQVQQLKQCSSSDVVFLECCCCCCCSSCCKPALIVLFGLWFACQRVSLHPARFACSFVWPCPAAWPLSARQTGCHFIRGVQTLAGAQDEKPSRARAQAKWNQDRRPLH